MKTEPEKIKPVLGIEQTEELHKLFFKQFQEHFIYLKTYNKSSFTYLINSGLFLHLTLESYITWIIVYLLNNINRNKNRRLKKIWSNHFENGANLKKKIQFFADAFLPEAKYKELKDIDTFCRKLGDLRNKIVHGHEVSIIRWSDGKTDKSAFAELLTYETILAYSNEFETCMQQISVLLEKIDIEDLTSGIPSKDWVVKYLMFNQFDQQDIVNK